MAWIDRLIDYVPYMTESGGAWAVIGGAVGMVSGLILASPPLAIGAVLLGLAGVVGPALSAMKQEMNPSQPNLSPSQEAEENAAVAALERDVEAFGRFQAMVANEERPSRGRMH